MSAPALSRCFVDESIHPSLGMIVTSFVFSPENFEDLVAEELRTAGLSPFRDEFKSGNRMEDNPKMREARARLLSLAAGSARIAIFFGPLNRSDLGRQTLQALQTILIRNGIQPGALTLHIDQGIFESTAEGKRLLALFHYLQPAQFFFAEDSRLRLGVQVADAVAHAFAQILREPLTDSRKVIDIGGEDTGYVMGTQAPLGWSLLMGLRQALLARPVVYRGETYSPGTDPVVLDPVYDDVTVYGQNPVVLGWGIQVAHELPANLQQTIAHVLSRIWLGCIH